MPIRYAVTRVTGQGEQVTTDVCQWNPVTGDIIHQTTEEMHKLLSEALSYADLRMHEMNLRALEGYNLQHYCSAETWGKIVDVIDVICGRQDGSNVARRWQAAIEETAELEAGRLAASYGAHNESMEYTENTMYDRPAWIDHSMQESSTLTFNKRQSLREQIAELGCTCADKHQYQCPIHNDDGRGA